MEQQQAIESLLRDLVRELRGANGAGDTNNSLNSTTTANNNTMTQGNNHHHHNHLDHHLVNHHHGHHHHHHHSHRTGGNGVSGRNVTLGMRTSNSSDTTDPVMEASGGAWSGDSSTLRDSDETTSTIRQLRKLLAAIEQQSGLSPSSTRGRGSTNNLNHINHHVSHPLMNGDVENHFQTVETTLESISRSIQSSSNLTSELMRNLLDNSGHSGSSSTSNHIMTLLLLQNQQLLQQQQQLMVHFSLILQQQRQSSSQEGIPPANCSCVRCHPPPSSPGVFRSASLGQNNLLPLSSFGSNQQLPNNFTFVSNLPSGHSTSNTCPNNIRRNSLTEASGSSGVKRPFPSPIVFSNPVGSNNGQNQAQPTLNNQVTPGSRANNYYDNFRSFTRQNQLNGPTLGSGSGNSSVSNWSTQGVKSETSGSSHIDQLSGQLQDSLSIEGQANGSVAPSNSPASGYPTTTSPYRFRTLSTDAPSRHDNWFTNMVDRAVASSCPRRKKSGANHHHSKKTDLNPSFTTNPFSLEKVYLEKCFNETKNTNKANNLSAAAATSATSLVSASASVPDSSTNTFNLPSSLSFSNELPTTNDSVTTASGGPDSTTGAIRKRHRGPVNVTTNVLNNDSSTVEDVAATGDRVAPPVVSEEENSHRSDRKTTAATGGEESHFRTQDSCPEEDEDVETDGRGYEQDDEEDGEEDLQPEADGEQGL